jgi:MFS family permease
MSTRLSAREYREWAVLLVSSAAMFLNTVDISILNVAMPVIERDLVVDNRVLQWLQGAYGLFYAGFLLLSGRLADLVGRRRIFLVGISLFGAASGFQNTCLQAGGAIGTALAATALSSFGGDLAALTPGAQASALTLAVVALASVAVLGALLLLASDRRGQRGQCACATNR